MSAETLETLETPKIKASKVEMSTSLLPRNSERVSAQKEANGQPQMPLFPRFPAEIMHKILCSVLICPEHLSFTRLPLSAKERAARPPPRNPRNWQAQFSNVLRLCLWNKCNNDEPEAPALHRDFGSLCLVSRQIRDEARDVLFSKNKWVLHCTSSFDAIQWVLKFWGQEAVRSMTDLRLEAQAAQYRMVEIYQSLANFVDAVKDGHSLQRLSVQWILSEGQLQCARPVGNNWSPHEIAVVRDRGLERNSEGGRGSKDWEEYDGSLWEGPQSEPESWAAREVMLQPLKYIRAVREVRIEGTVTENWAQYLEMAMSASADAGVPDLELQQRAKEGLERLEKGLEEKFEY